MLTVVMGGKASPGASVTSWAMTLGWPRPVLAVDADPAGGDLMVGMLPGRVRADHGLMTWAATTRGGMSLIRAAEELPKHSVTFTEAPGAWLMPGFATAMQGLSMTEEGWARLAGALERADGVLGRDAIVDCGRVGAAHTAWPVVRAAHRVLVCVRPSVRSVRGAQECVERVRHERGDTESVACVVVGSGPYSQAEISGALEVPVAVHLPWDVAAAAAFSDGQSMTARMLARSRLVRTAGAWARETCATAVALPVVTGGEAS